jgi:hypothetical protein
LRNTTRYGRDTGVFEFAEKVVVVIILCDWVTGDREKIKKLLTQI